MATVNISAMAKTWNDAGTTFTAIGLDVTDTASNAASLLMDLQVGSSSVFNVNKRGDVEVAQSASFTAPSFKAAGFETGLSMTANTLVCMVSNGTGVTSFKFNQGLMMQKALPISWGSANVNGGADVFLYRDAAASLALRNGATAQELRLYNTFTDASNYERLAVKWNANVLEMVSEAAGTGTARQMKWGVGTGAGTRSFETGAVAGSNAIIFNSVYIQVSNYASDSLRKIWITKDQGVRFASGNGITWGSSTTTAALTQDTGVVRNAAGVVKITDGSTGIGELIFKVPTSDPGITGALWNNAGTLAISA